ncbi:MAG TPA: ankyrin repeat domain-containing protein [Candidatus Acidoferrum sp.]|nr:ankyrin repeat domain-containing protein [Candidatus Acidoferrum sp.]
MRVLGNSSTGIKQLHLSFTIAVVAVAAALLAPLANAVGSLAAAARTDDLAQSRQLLKAGANVNTPEPDGTSALLWAVYNSSTPLVQLLLDAHADANAANELGITPLLQASRNGNAVIITALLAHGAKLDPTPHTEPALMSAARAGNVDAVKVLLKAGANPNATEPLDQQTALMWAVAGNHLDVAKVLLDAGADPNLQSRISELTKRKNADFPTGGFAALHWAARNGDEAMIKLLLAHKANINVRNGDGSTPMMLAIVNDRFDTAALLLDLKADADDGSLFYVTEMRDATTDWRARDGTVYRADHPNKLNALDLTRKLLEAGASPNKPFTVQMHNTSMCCDINVYSTAFYRAATAADVEGLKLMLAHGADTGWKPDKVAKADDPVASSVTSMKKEVTKTALMMAITGGKGVGVSGGPNDLRYGPPVFREKGDRAVLDAVNVLLQAGADVNAIGPDQETALHVAAKALDPAIVKALVAKGAALDAKDKDGLTAEQAVAKMEAPKPREGFYFQAPPAQPLEMAALLKTLAAEKSGDHAQ